MTRDTRYAWLLLATIAVAQAKPLDFPLDESINEIDHGTNLRESPLERQLSPALPTNQQPTAATVPVGAINPAAGSAIATTVRAVDEVSTAKPGPLAWFLTPLAQKLQFSPQAFLQDRLALLKEVLNSLSINAPQNATTRQLGVPGGLLHFSGPNDSGFYTNRLDPAGFLGGNGWFANKGGILGGPGAILSTGSLLTDYPTSYRK